MSEGNETQIKTEPQSLRKMLEKSALHNCKNYWWKRYIFEYTCKSFFCYVHMRAHTHTHFLYAAHLIYQCVENHWIITLNDV